MADFQPFAGMSQEDTNQTMLYLLSAILEKLPRIDSFDRLIVNGSEVAAATASIGTVTTVSTVSDITRVTNLGAAATGKSADAIPLHLSNSGAIHLYDQIKVT